MIISPIAPRGTFSPAAEPVSPSTTPTRAPASSQAMLDREAFLKLLVAQLRYQDPSKPIDSSEMISQSAQLSVVDKLTEITDALDRTAAAERLSLAGSIVGQRISFTGPDGYPLVATVDHVRVTHDSLMVGAGGFDVPLEAILAVSGPAVTDRPEPTTNAQETPS